MDKRIILAAVIVLILGIGGFYLGTKLLPGSSPSPSPAITQASSAAVQKAPSSLTDLLTQGGTAKCSFNNEGDPGTVYVSAGSARLDFNSTFYSSGTPINNVYHMITDGTSLYIWKNDEKTGVQTALRVLSTPGTPVPGDYTQQSDYVTGAFLSGANYKYSCTSWTADTTLFNPPQNISFVKSPALTITVTPVPIPTTSPKK